MIETTPPPAAPVQLPLFYKNPVMISMERHGSLRIKQGWPFSFAARTNIIPLTAFELPAAAKHYPITFAPGQDPYPLAIVGVEPDENLFVDAQGNWAPGTYIPLYVQRYPFIFNDVPGQQPVLAIDEDAGVIGDEGDLIFVDGKPSERVQNILQFCENFSRQFLDTRAISDVLRDNKLVTHQDLNLTLPTGQPMRLSNYGMIDDVKFAAILDATFIEWRRRGWLDPLYAIRHSNFAWQALLDRFVARKMAQQTHTA